MLSIRQLDSISKEKKVDYDNLIANKAIIFYTNVKAAKLYKYHDSLVDSKLAPEILDNFELKNKNIVISDAIQSIKRITDRNKNNLKRFKDSRKILNLYDYEYSYRISFALACLVLFFVGAPLGSIIRKGGFGLPMIMAICVFVIYFFISQLGKNLAEESAISALFGSWLSTIILLPFGILLTRRAAKGMGIFNVDAIFDNIKKFFLRFYKNNSTSDE
jgi:lipopolysaccharide export system permease protein